MSASCEPGSSLLKFVTSGSVDDGKSTLIGRLLVETGSVFEDQLEAVRRCSKGIDGLDYSLILDGLAAEREQGITIDVAYRYFSTPKRKFVVADCPGHEQYTRNMFTGASGADLALILLDAQRGIQTQSRRHGYLASLLRIPELVVAVNKMDLVDFSQSVFEAMVTEYREFSQKLNIPNIRFIPVSALAGDNVTSLSSRTPWYDGPSLLDHLESVSVDREENWSEAPFRFPVQWVCRPNSEFRGYSGELLSGEVRPGDTVRVLPSGRETRVREVLTFDGAQSSAGCQQAVTLTIEDELDVSRGDMLVAPDTPPTVSNHFQSLVCWLDELPLDTSRRYLLKHTTREVMVEVKRIVYRLDVNTLHRQGAECLALNDVGRVEMEASAPVFFDPYNQSREMGSFILIDPESHQTVAGGMIQSYVGPGGRRSLRPFEQRATNIQYDPWDVTRAMREELNGHEAAVFWLTGLPSSGKSTLGNLLGQELFSRGIQVFRLDGDKLRSGLCADLAFSREEREENLRRVGEVAKLFYDSGQVVVCSFVSPYQKDRDFLRSLIGERFFEIHVQCSLETCKARDPKGNYRKALAGTIPTFTGVSAPYEVPEQPDLILDTEAKEPGALVKDAVHFLRDRGVIG